eukprot:CAMPEP_0202442280 /NCGR_PEP_ID=MMETSP1360-20130828/1743_1 /ASSEMBLY_ACC=CAM_ASM_000848 /TAXON_ID=515479 /ORGANISM="Licmophora paradoxa, Strain CCMP2313" /LENGTH=110 /DNA_ID=CAMNT_0049057605 /DNA_START=193 /DNA_END=525 /DNA_ORIENTATION=+
MTEAFPVSSRGVSRIGFGINTNTKLHAKYSSEYFDDLKLVLGGGGSASKTYMDSLSAKNKLKKIIGSEETISGSAVGPGSYLDSLPHDDETSKARGSGFTSYLDGLKDTQ